jgi:hypothetical protein
MTEESRFNSEQENGAKISSCITFNTLKTCGSENNKALQTTEINRHAAGTDQDAGRTKRTTLHQLLQNVKLHNADGG